MLAMRMDAPEVELTEPEAEAFLTAAQNVARHYAVETTQRTLDWIAFVGVTAQVFGTRALTVVVKRKRVERGEVVAFPSGSPMNGTPHYPIEPEAPH